MLDKAATVPGAKIIVDQPRDGLTKGDAGKTDGVSIFHQAGGFFNGGMKAPSGVILEVVKKPRRVGGINSVRLRTPCGFEGESYWCEVRASCAHLPPENAQ